MTSVMDSRKFDCWVLASAEFRFSVTEKAKLFPASEANGTWEKLAMPNI
jgi:hypothetical protein